MASPSDASMMAQIARLSDLAEEQTKKTAEMRGGRSQWSEPVLLQACLDEVNSMRKPKGLKRKRGIARRSLLIIA